MTDNPQPPVFDLDGELDRIAALCGTRNVSQSPTAPADPSDRHPQTDFKAVQNNTWSKHYWVIKDAGGRVVAAGLDEATALAFTNSAEKDAIISNLKVRLSVMLAMVSKYRKPNLADRKLCELELKQIDQAKAAITENPKHAMDDATAQAPPVGSLIEDLEPDARHGDPSPIEAHVRSIALSVKRIADLLDGTTLGVNVSKTIFGKANYDQ